MLKRTNYCGELREDSIGSQVVVSGWVQRSRNLGSLIFTDIRDREGIVQAVFDSEISKKAFSTAENLKNEYVVSVKGSVRKRESVNDALPTGKIEIVATDIEILSQSQTTPIHINDDDEAGERLRLKYRYLDLRKPKMQSKLRMRSDISKSVRNFLSDGGFLEIETPVLNKPTPEGARDYLVPSRVNPGKFYALPQSPQMFKQLLMCSGFDKYYQIVKCFRDEDLRADRQPEFTQIDIEMSFAEIDDVIDMGSKLVQKVFKDVLNTDINMPIRRMKYKEAMERFGSDKPDLRFGFELVDLSRAVETSDFKVFTDALSGGGSVRCINVKGFESDFSRKDIDRLGEFAKTYGAKGLAWIRNGGDGVNSPISKFFSQEEMNRILSAANSEKGDLILIVADDDATVFNILGALRCEIASKLDILNPGVFEFVWITDFPLFEYDEEEKRYFAKHHPFTSPANEDIDILKIDPSRVRAMAYDLVVNGFELGGGSIRIHTTDVQKMMFTALGMSDEEAEEKFGFFTEAFKYGTPPHGGIAFGLDRLVMLMTQSDNIREVIAFPKTQNATCLMSEAPCEADDVQLEELEISVNRIKTAQ